MILRNSFITLILFFISSIFLQGQVTSSYWQQTDPAQLLVKDLDRRIIPSKFLTMDVDLEILDGILSMAPDRYDTGASKTGVVIDIPMPDGNFEEFMVYYAGLLPKTLQKKFNRLKHYTGYGITDPSAKIKLDITPKGFHGFILSPQRETVFIDPYARGNTQHHIIYYSKDFSKSGKTFDCEITEEMKAFAEPKSNENGKAGDCQFREYVLALACTGEYAQYHDDGDDGNGDIVEDAMAAMTTSMNRVNGVFEIDAGLTMVFVANNDTLIFTDGGTDPYSNGNGGAMLGENQTTCDDRIGSANYDIGHVFSTGGGGVAYLNAPCNNSIKAGGVTGQGTPEGDPFDIDYVAHEMGHQYGANHTQNNNCNRNNSTSYEPGSASTIMGYAGICAPNVQNNSDDYFHGISLSEIGSFTTGSGNSCADIIDDTNSKPDIDPISDYSIPISTPFILTAVATDPEGDPITYCWEQWDRQVATMPPVSTSTVGPAFRSLDPTTAPTRSFPKESVVAGSGTDTWEVLPSVSRDLNFRLNVRDNNSAYGCTEHEEMLVTSIAGAGPFLVTYPNTSVNWNANDTETVTWDVANTDSGSVNCANVDISLSTDGGLSFPISLASGVPNDGSQDITVPDVVSALVRIKVACSDNIFYDISDENILIGVSEACISFTSQDVPKNISSNGTVTVTSDLELFIDAEITDVDVINLSGDHTWVGDLEINIIDPTSQNVNLVDNQCGNDDDFDVGFDDDQNALACPYNTGTVYSPNNSLSAFNGLNTKGNWTLEINDTADGDGGALTSWGLQVCYIKIPCVPSAEIPTATGVYTGNFECEDDLGWTHYMHVTAQDDTFLLLSVDKGASGVELNAGQVKVEVLSGTQAIDLSSAPYVTNPNGRFAMRRYWDVNPTMQPGSNVDVRFYYSDTDYSEITAADAEVLTHEDMKHYKINGTDDPDPSTGHTGVDMAEYEEPIYTYSAYNAHHLVEFPISSFSGGGGGGASATEDIVPVDFISFTAQAKGSEIVLKWTTANEINNDGFDIMRSNMLEGEFENIGKVSSYSNPGAWNEYQFNDSEVVEGVLYYYRLRQNDLDGGFKYSAIRTAMLEDVKYSINIHPNPSEGPFLVSSEDADLRGLQIEVYNLSGQLLKTIHNNGVGDSEIQINLNHLNSGNYLLKIYSDKISEIRRITKL